MLGRAWLKVSYIHSPIQTKQYVTNTSVLYLDREDGHFTGLKKTFPSTK